MKEVFMHVVFGPDLDFEDDYEDAGISLRGLVPGEFGDNWIDMKAKYAKRVHETLSKPTAEEHGSECDLCETLAMENDNVVPAMVRLDIIREFAPMWVDAIERGEV